MYHAVWKLIALGAVVAVGVLVVVVAQQGMQDTDAGAEHEVATTDADDSPGNDAKDAAEATEPPPQGEPDLAADDETSIAAVPAAVRLRNRNGNTAGGGATLNDGELDEDTALPIQKTGAVDKDPFDDGEDAGMSSPPKSSPRRKPSRAATPKNVAIDIVDVVDDEDEDPALASKPEARSTAVKRPLPGDTRGPVLMLDSPDDDDQKTESDADDAKSGKTGPRLLGATDDGSGRPARAAKAKTDPFADDDELPVTLGKGPRTAPVAEEEADPADEDAPPARLPRSVLDSKAKPVAPKPPVDEIDAVTDDLPADVEEEKRPARPLKMIEPEDPDEQPLPKLVGKAPKPGPALEATPREMPVLTQPATGQPAIPQADEPLPDEPMAEELPAPRKAETPQLTIDKVAPPTAVLGEPMVYHIRVRNTGAIPAHQVVVEDVVPDNVKLDGSIPQAQLKQNRLIWKLGTLGPGREKKISVRVIPQSEGTVGSVATVNFSPEAQSPVSANAPRIKFVVESPRKAAVGMPVDFNFSIKNIGTVPATGVTIRDVLPAALKHSEGDDLEFTIGQIPAGKTHDVKLTLTAAVAGPTVNRVVVTADGNVSEEAEVRLEVVGPTLAVVRNGPKKLFPDKTGRYSNTVTNTGGRQVSEVTIAEVVPAGMEFVEAENGGQYNAAKRTVNWMITQLKPGESKTAKVVLRSTTRGAQISVVRAYDNSGASGETVGTTHIAGVPALKIEIGDLAALVEVGEMVKVPVRVLNRGSDVATTVRTSVVVPVGMQFVSARGPVEHRVAPAAARGGAGTQGTSGATEVQFAPIGKIDSKADAVYELTFKARVPGATRVEVHTQCEQMGEPIRSEEPTTIVSPQ